MLSDWKDDDLTGGERRNDLIFRWKMLLKIFPLTSCSSCVCLPLMQRIRSEKSTFLSIRFWRQANDQLTINRGKLSADRCLGLLPVCKCQPHHSGCCWSFFLCSCLCLRAIPVRVCSFEIKVCWNPGFKMVLIIYICATNHLSAKNVNQEFLDYLISYLFYDIWSEILFVI